MFDLLKALLNGLFGPVVPSLEAALPYVPYMLGVLVALVCVVRFGTPFVLALVRRLITRTPRSLFKAKATLLAQPDICELYAPANQYITDREEGKKGGKQFAWLSPFPRAVRASIKRNPVSKNRKLNARAQVATAAKSITVRTPHPADNVAGDLEEHYRIDMKLDGNDKEQLKRMEGRVKAQLGLHSVERLNTSDNYSLSMIAHVTEPMDILTEHGAGVEFFDEHPAKVPYSLPLALRSDGNPWALATHHTLIYGMTGSGKGSPLHGIVRQLSPYVSDGRAKLYGIDPKASELRPYMESSLFEEVVSENEEAQEIIAQLHGVMKERARTKTVDLKNANLGRSLDATQETPMIVLVIDEMLSLLIALKGLGKPGAATMTLLTEILAQGRSLNVFVIGATQAVDKELLGRMRVNFANMILLRQESPYNNDLFLGEGAKERGYDSTAIPMSSKANGYAYAGIGYVKEDTGAPVKVRFAYSSDEDLAELIQEFPKDEFNDFGELPSLPAQVEDEAHADLELPNLEDDFANLPNLDDLDEEEARD